jgi:hypothetical protein
MKDAIRPQHWDKPDLFRLFPVRHLQLFHEYNPGGLLAVPDCC